nr:MAG TPA: hypothetical protein [Caudoviricetes sp.]
MLADGGGDCHNVSHKEHRLSLSDLCDETQKAADSDS